MAKAAKEANAEDEEEVEHGSGEWGVGSGEWGVDGWMGGWVDGWMGGWVSKGEFLGCLGLFFCEAFLFLCEDYLFVSSLSLCCAFVRVQDRA
jgi:hypothetical protein